MNFKSWYAEPLVRLNDLISSYLRTSRILVRFLFGANVTKGLRVQYWDYTTLVLKKALVEFTRPNQRVLEIGVGDYAILSIFLIKYVKNISLTAVDIVPQVVGNAKETCARNNVSIPIMESDIFSNCGGIFDLVFWNCPYVPRAAQLNRKPAA